MSRSVCSITLARNSRDLVRAQMSLLQKQSRPLSEIVVVDNGCTDGTSEMLKKEFPEVTIIHLAENLGVGGGYAVGLNYAAYEKDYDWCWLLDQDSAPQPDLLEQLLQAVYGPANDNVAIIAPVPIHSYTGRAYGALLWQNRYVRPPQEENASVQYVDLVISSGSLMRSSAIREVGLPRADFFIDFVDFEHCLRFRQAGYSIGIARNCTMPHAIGEPIIVSELGVERVRGRHLPWREYYKIRNLTFSVWHEISTRAAKAFVIRSFLRHLVGIIFYDPEKWIRFKFMLRGLRDGIRGNLGITVRPD